MQYKLGFIGCGNMGGALIKAAAKTLDGKEIAACDYSLEKVQALEMELGIVGVDVQEIAQNADFIVLGVKPQVLDDVLAPIAEILRNRSSVTLVTMAAGRSIASVQACVGSPLPTIRIMPNTPVAVGEGMILYSLSRVSQETHAAFLEYFQAAGKFDLIPEEEIDSGSALSGCGPAFAYAFAEGLIKGALESGVPADKATLYSAQTMKGAAEMLLTFGNPDALKKAVCSPNGTTIEGVKTLDEQRFDEVTASAVRASYKRTLELKK